MMPEIITDKNPCSNTCKEFHHPETGERWIALKVTSGKDQPRVVETPKFIWEMINKLYPAGWRLKYNDGLRLVSNINPDPNKKDAICSFPGFVFCLNRQLKIDAGEEVDDLPKSNTYRTENHASSKNIIDPDLLVMVPASVGKDEGGGWRAKYFFYLRWGLYQKGENPCEVLKAKRLANFNKKSSNKGGAKK